MLFAELHSKLGRDSSLAHDRAEDLLTSTSFQLLRYVPIRAGLLPIVSRVRRVRWHAGGAVVEPARPEWLEVREVDEFELDFWPRWPGAGEPDVVLRLLQRGMIVAKVVIEVKLDSPKSPRLPAGADDSGVGPAAEGRRRDQLWDYFDRLSREPGDHRTGLIYLTSHPSPPYDELGESLDCCPSSRERDWLGWLSWRDVWAVTSRAEELPARDLADILAAKGLNAFSGFRAIPPAGPRPAPRFYHPWFAPRRGWIRPTHVPPLWAGRRS